MSDPERSAMKFYTRPGIYSAIGIVTAPFIILILIFVVVHFIAYDGTGPDDSAGMLAGVVAFPVALFIAILLWSFSLIRFAVWVGNRQSSQDCQLGKMDNKPKDPKSEKKK